MRQRRRPLVALVLLGIFFVAAGVLTFATAGPVRIGWAAYAPLAETISFQGAVLLDTRRRVALLVVVAGAVVLSAVAGYVLGRRHAPDSARSSRAGTEGDR